MTHKLKIMKQFNNIYKTKKWGESRLYPGHGGSGTGSSIEYLKEFISFIQRYILDNQISSFLDVGCGECEWQRIINWEQLNCQFIGIELLPDVVERVQSDLKGRKNMTVIQGNCLEMQLPKTDLALVKEVFQHWSIHITNSFLNKLCRTSKHCLTYNCDTSYSFFSYNAYRYFISKNLEVHNEVIDDIVGKLLEINWDSEVGGFRPCNFDIYGKKLATFKWKWHFPASLVLIERIAEEAEKGSVIFNETNFNRSIEQLTGGKYEDTDIFYSDKE